MDAHLYFLESPRRHEVRGEVVVLPEGKPERVPVGYYITEVTAGRLGVDDANQLCALIRFLLDTDSRPQSQGRLRVLRWAVQEAVVQFDRLMFQELQRRGVKIQKGTFHGALLAALLRPQIDAARHRLRRRVEWLDLTRDLRIEACDPKAVWEDWRGRRLRVPKGWVPGFRFSAGSFSALVRAELVYLAQRGYLGRACRYYDCEAWFVRTGQAKGTQAYCPEHRDPKYRQRVHRRRGHAGTKERRRKPRKVLKPADTLSAPKVGERR